MTDLSLSQEQRMLADSVRRYVERGYDAQRREASLAHPQGCLPETWRDFGDFGWLGLPLSEADGGMGGSLADVCLVSEELGRGAVNEPFIACAVLANPVLAQMAPAPVKARWLSALGDGSRRFALSHAPGLTAVADGDGVRVSGQAALVLGGAGADGYLLATDPQADGTAVLVLVEVGVPGLTAEVLSLYDGQRVARLHLDRVPVQESLWRGPGAQLQAGVARVLARAALAHCAETVGAMQAAYEITLDYLKTRKQFGRALSANQVVQHRLVDLMVEIEEARALTRAAAGVLDDPASAEALRLRYGAAAKACVAHAARLVWKEAVQLHGAIGMTQEYQVGQYVKRLAAATTLFGSEEAHLERLAAVSLGYVAASA